MTDHIQIGDVSPRVRFAANGVDTEFPFGFPIFKDADLRVYVDGVERETGFIVTGAGQSAGGTVTFDIAPAHQAVVVLLRRLAIVRTTDFQESGEFRAKAINDELDYQTAALQQIADDVERAMALDPTDATASIILPLKDERAGKYLAFDAEGKAMAAAGEASVAVSSSMEPVVQAANLTAARDALGLGDAATKNVGTAEGEIVAVQAGGALPALDGSALTGVVAGATDAERANILLNAFRIQLVGGLSMLDMIDGVVDEFEDQSGINIPVEYNRIPNIAVNLRYSYSTYDAENAYDSNTATYWFSNQAINSNSNGIDYLGCRMAGDFKITKARIFNVDQAPATVKVQYSDDGSAWSDAVASWSMSGSIGAFISTTWEGVGSHAYWRLLSSSATTADGLGNASSGWKCAELEFYEVEEGGSVNAAYDSTGDFYTNLGTLTPDLMPAMTSNTTPSGTITSTSLQAGVAWKGFDDSLSDDSYIYMNGGAPWWFVYQFPTAKVAQGYTIYPQGTQYWPLAWQFLGSNDGTNWTVLDTRSVATGYTGLQTFTFNNSTAYTHYKLNITSCSSGTYCWLMEFEILGRNPTPDMTLVSETATAETQPDEALLVVWEEDVDTISPNQDLTAYVTRDGGTTWTEATLIEEGNLSAGRILTASADLSAQPDGTSMAWKLVSANTKQLRIHGVGLEWR